MALPAGEAGEPERSADMGKPMQEQLEPEPAPAGPSDKLVGIDPGILHGFVLAVIALCDAVGPVECSGLFKHVLKHIALGEDADNVLRDLVGAKEAA
jgi:hypothetical protein